jgi:hypothetical protein
MIEMRTLEQSICFEIITANRLSENGTVLEVVLKGAEKWRI